ncbi:MAG TPA: DUF167 domain-containing protein [Candidatus Binatia bacterium]|nr:DUF167 domain-containing protein [Candidatus Binatia bacterium]
MSDEPAGAWLEPAVDGCVLHLWVVPGSSRSGVVGPHGDALRVRVIAPPERGAANREVLTLVAHVLGVGAGDVTLEAGGGGRRKRVRVRGVAAAEARRRLVSHRSVDTSGGDN